MASSWLTTLLFGYRYIRDAGVLMPERSTINFVGATVTDDPALKRTVVEIPSTAVLASATPNATPDTLVLRNGSAAANFGGTCNFATLQSSVAINCVDITASATCSADTIEATTLVSCAVHTAPSNGFFGSASQTAGSTDSGMARFASGDAIGLTSDTGFARLSSGLATRTSGDVLIFSGDSSGGATGSVVITTGESSSTGDAGNIVIAPSAAGGSGLDGSIALGGEVFDFGSGERVIWIADCTTAPSVAPASGGILYVDGADGSLHFFSTSGVDSILAPTSAGVLVDATTTVNVGVTDRHVIVGNASAVTVNLPVGVLGERHHIKNKGAGIATITPSGGQTIFDSASVATLGLALGDAADLLFDGTHWSVM